jgi:hypothetical protein
LKQKANKSVRKQSATKKRTSTIAQQRPSKGTSETLSEQTKNPFDYQKLGELFNLEEVLW